MTSPGFPSAALLVHLSGLRMAIRRACRHFSFFYVTNQFVMLCVNIVSSVSLALLFVHAIQSSCSSSWFDVLTVSFSIEILLSWSYSSFVMVSLVHIHSFRQFGCISYLSLLRFLFLFSPCLNDETKHSALGGAEHVSCSFCSPCSGTLRHCRCDNNVKQM